MTNELARTLDLRTELTRLVPLVADHPKAHRIVSGVLRDLTNPANDAVQQRSARIKARTVLSIYGSFLVQEGEG